MRRKEIHFNRLCKVSRHSTQAGSIPLSGGLTAALPDPPLVVYSLHERRSKHPSLLPVLPLELWAKAKEWLAPPLVPGPTLPRGKFSWARSR